jgi:hypothetical protein
MPVVNPVERLYGDKTSTKKFEILFLRCMFVAMELAGEPIPFSKTKVINTFVALLNVQDREDLVNVKTRKCS